MLRLRLVHWNAEEAREQAVILADAGYEVSCEVPRGPEFLRELKNNPPAVVVVNLSRMPSQGRDLALLIRKNGATRRIPLVFVGGEESTVTRIREILPNVVFTPWERIRSSLKRAGARGHCDLLICFIRSRAVLEREISGIAARTDYASVWFAWPKKASGVATDLSEKSVRECGLAAGLVDYKICAIDPTWSGLLFARRKSGKCFFRVFALLLKTTR